MADDDAAGGEGSDAEGDGEGEDGGAKQEYEKKVYVANKDYKSGTIEKVS
jgi:hypothetical protein